MNIKKEILKKTVFVLNQTKIFKSFFKREAKETVLASKILLDLSKGKEVSPEQIEFLKEQSIDLAKAVALLGLQAVPGSSVAIVALEKVGEKHGFTLFPKSQSDSVIEIEDYLKNKEKCYTCGNKSFFSTSESGITIKLACGVCETVYVRNEEKGVFEQIKKDKI